MIKQLIQESPHKSFRVLRISNSVAICEANAEDRYGWGNATEEKPAFIVYLGCRQNEVAGYIKTFNNFYNCHYCEARTPKYLKQFEVEIKVRGMMRHGQVRCYGLDDLLRTEASRHASSYNIDLDYCIGDMADNFVFAREEYQGLSPTLIQSVLFEAVGEWLEKFSTDPEQYVSDRLIKKLDKAAAEYSEYPSIA